jgi:L-gulonolactone oxidase
MQKAELISEFVENLGYQQIECEQRIWKNFMGNVVKENATVVYVKTQTELQTVIKLVAETNEKAGKKQALKVRAAAGSPKPTKKKENPCSWVFRRLLGQVAPRDIYAESFSATSGAKSDIIICFDENYKSTEYPRIQIDKEKRTVRVAAGVTIADLVDALAKEGLKLDTASMTAYVTAIGLAANAGHGTGRNQPSFAGLILELNIVDSSANIRTINPDSEDFADIAAAHLGLFGVVSDMTLQCSPITNIREDINRYNTTADLRKDLAGYLQNSDYLTIFGMQDKIETRRWTPTNDPVTVEETPKYNCGWGAFFQQLEIDLGSAALSWIVSHPQLAPFYLEAACEFEMYGEDSETRVLEERDATHYQEAFPKKLLDRSLLFPVKDEDAANILGGLLQHVEDLKKTYAAKGKYPLTYGFYVRYFKGTNGGFSTSATAEGERTLAFEMVGHPDSPGLKEFMADVEAYLTSKEIHYHYHLGKDMPEGMTFTKIFGADKTEHMKKVVERYHAKGKSGKEFDPETDPFTNEFVYDMMGYNETPVAAIASESKTNIASAVGDSDIDWSARKRALEQCRSKFAESEHLSTFAKSDQFTSFFDECSKVVQTRENEMRRGRCNIM